MTWKHVFAVAVVDCAFGLTKRTRSNSAVEFLARAAIFVCSAVMIFSVFALEYGHNLIRRKTQ